MRFKVYLTANARRVVEANHYVNDDRLPVFMKDGKPVLTCILTNVTCFYGDDDETAPVPLGAQVGGFAARI
jgi:hypothetical protein